jgi:formate dehydrogenase iron-sulfur subunit
MDACTFTKINFTELEYNGRFRWVFNKTQCMHCEHPACVEACIVGALEKQPDGPVTYDDHKCIGCRYCQVACPFGIPNFEWDKPMPWIRKCTFCADRQAAGLRPACVTTCPTGALVSGDREVLLAEARQRIASSPGKYVDHIYGEKEVGGTSWLYLSPVPFEKLGFASVGSEAVTINAARAMGLVPPVLLGVAATMTGVYLLTKRRHKLEQLRKDYKAGKTNDVGEEDTEARQ